MSTQSPVPSDRPLRLEFPQSLAVYDDYAAAQRTVDFLADEEFPVEHCMIVGTDLKRIERITGRLTTGRVAAGGIMSGLWLGLFVGLIFSIFTEENTLAVIVSTAVIGAAFGVIMALVGYALGWLVWPLRVDTYSKLWMPILGALLAVMIRSVVLQVRANRHHASPREPLIDQHRVAEVATTAR